jgi:hypothetical protein
MTKTRPRVILPIVSLALLGAATAAHAAPKTTRSATVEVVELDGKGAQSTVRFTLALDPRRTSELDTSADRTSYRLRIHGDLKDPRAPLIDLQLARTRSSKERGGETIKISVSARVAVGRRVVLSQIARPGGGELQVAVTLS